MFGAAKENGARTRDPVLRMFAAGRARGVGMGSPGGTAAGKSADRIERRADCHDHRARASAHSQARRFCESLSDRRRDVAVLPPGGLVGLAGAMLAGNAFLGVAHAALGSKASANRHQAGSNLANLAAPEEQSSSTVIVVRPANTSTAAKSFASTEQAGKDKDNDKLKEKKQERDEEQASGKESYLEGMEAAGFKSLTADELIAMKIQGVTPAYVKEIHELGMKPTVEELIGMRVQGITPEYLRDMRNLAPNLGIDELIVMKFKGITPQ